MNLLDHLTIKLDKNSYECNVNQELKVDPNNMNEEFERQAGKFAWWGTLMELARNDYLKKRQQRKETEASEYAELRKLFEKDGKRVTEKQLETKVTLSPKVKACVIAEIEAQKQANILAVITEAFRQRKDMLVSLGSNLRTEMKDVKVLKEQGLE